MKKRIALISVTLAVLMICMFSSCADMYPGSAGVEDPNGNYNGDVNGENDNYNDNDDDDNDRTGNSSNSGSSSNSSGSSNSGGSSNSNSSGSSSNNSGSNNSGSSGNQSSASSVTLPDPGAFLHGKVSRSTDEKITNGRSIIFLYEEDGCEGAEEYAELLSDPRFHLRLTDEGESKEWSDGDFSRYYVFEYTGSGNVGSVAVSTSSGSLTAPVILHFTDLLGNGAMTVSYSDGFELSDMGDRSTYASFVDRNTGGTSGSSGDGGDADHPGNSGGGSTGHWEWQKVKVDCPSCVGGICPLCNGSGVYRMYGQSIPCERRCSVCDGLGYFYQDEYVYVP